MKKVIITIVLIVLIIFLFACQKTSNEKGKIKKQTILQAETYKTEKVKDIDRVEIQNDQLFFVSSGSYKPEMIFVEGGEFIMGHKYVRTNQLHEVKLSSFYISKYMVTMKDWKDFLENVQLDFTWDWKSILGYGEFYNVVPSDDCPAQGLNWYYAIIFCNWVSFKDGYEPAYIIERLPKEFEDIEVKWNKKANGYRLPTDAEWEYAARGGQLSKGYLYVGSNNPDEIGRFGNKYKTSYPVGQFTPNELGIHDMGGCAMEWCWDWYDELMFKWLPIKNPSVDIKNSVMQKSESGLDIRVIRGAGWSIGYRETANRSGSKPNAKGFIGIRLVRNSESESSVQTVINDIPNNAEAEKTKKKYIDKNEIEWEHEQKQDLDNTKEILEKYARYFSGSWSRYPSLVDGKRNLSWGSVPITTKEYLLIDFLDDQLLYITGPAGQGFPGQVDSRVLYVKSIKAENEEEGLFRIFYEKYTPKGSIYHGDLGFRYDRENDTLTPYDSHGFPELSLRQYRVSEKIPENWKEKIKIIQDEMTENFLNEYALLLSGSWSMDIKKILGKHDSSWGNICINTNGYIIFDLIADEPVYISGRLNDDERVGKIKKVVMETVDEFRIFCIEKIESNEIKNYNFVVLYDRENDALAIIEWNRKRILSYETYYRFSDKLDKQPN